MDERAGLSHVLQVMNGFRRGALAGRYVILCTRPGEEWAVAQLCTDPQAPLLPLDDRRFGSVQAAQDAVDELIRGDERRTSA